jgi:uncharacterized protein (TIGR02996 family)
MPSDEPLLRAILDRPDDDHLRLVYADWLEENGQTERAEFIRVQIELSKEEADSPERRALAFRGRKLLDQHQQDWLGPIGALVREWRFCRGFLERIAVSAKTLQASGSVLFTSAPLQRLWITETQGDLNGLAAIPESNRLIGLDLCGNLITTEGLESLTHFSHLGGVQRLGLLFNRINDAGARLLCQHPFFQRLTLIRCGGNPITEPARQMLRDHFGDRVSFHRERDEDALYVIECGAISVGFGKDDTQLLIHRSELGVRILRFDHDGNPLDPIDLGSQTPYINFFRAIAPGQQREEPALLQELGYCPATIRVKRFHTPNGPCIADFSSGNGWPYVFEHPDDPDLDLTDIQNAHQWLETWLAEGRFMYKWFSSDCAINRLGEIVAP